MRPPSASSTRERVLFHLKTRGPQTATQVARRLSVTPVAVRQHLARLAEDGLVTHEDEAGRVGRPRRLWSVSEHGQEEFPDGHDNLALDILDAAREAFGARGVDQLVEHRTNAQIDAYRKRMPARSAPLSERVSALAAIRKEEGYMAEWSRLSDGRLRLIENHCPICPAARSCVGLCAGELRLFQTLLGSGVKVERTEYILDGDRRCTYEIG